MERLTIYLSPIDDVRFKAIGEILSGGGGETECVLPFQGESCRRATLLKMLDATAFRSADFPQEAEQSWMVQNGLLVADRKAFHPDMRACVGQALYQSLFPEGGKTRDLLASTLRSAERHGTQLHIQLKIAADVGQRARLPDYPWELLHDGQGFLAQRQVTFSRYIFYDATPPNWPPVDRVNVLLVSSTASDSERGLHPLPQEEPGIMHQALARAQAEGYIRVTTPDSATLDGLRDHLTSHRGDDVSHVIHFDGHGFYGRRCNNVLADGPACRTMHAPNSTECTRCGSLLPAPQGYLLFESDSGKAPYDYVSAQELGTLLHQNSFRDDTGRPRGAAVVVLSACRSGLSLGGDSIFNGVAQNLIEHRVPAVVAMLFRVTVDSAADFTRQFYRSLAQRDPLATAVSQGREAMGPEGDQWYRPVLYLRWQDNDGGQLFGSASTVVKGLETLSDLMQAPEIRSTVVLLQSDFAEARENIDVLSYYKDLHDQLHELQKNYNPIAREAQRFPDDEMSHDNLRDYTRTIEGIVGSVRAIAGRAPSGTLGTAWIQDLAQACQEMCQALDTSDVKPLRTAIWRINRVLAIHPSQINTRLNAMVHDLRLPALVKAMESVRDGLSRPELGSKRVREFADGVDTLTALNQRLVALLGEHDAWQAVDLELRRIEVMMEQDVTELERSWPDLTLQMEVLCNGNSVEWAMRLKEDGEHLALAIDAQDPRTIKQYFRSYRTRAAQRFYQVDVELKRLCDDLRGVGAPLTSVLRVIE